MYTKGEWYVSRNGKILVKQGPNFEEICQMPFGSCREADEMPEAEANARLIAAAPAMYEALKCWQTEGIVKATIPMMEAIAKVEGK